MFNYYFKTFFWLALLFTGGLALARAEQATVISVETQKTIDQAGNVIERRITKKQVKSTDVDFEAASIDGKLKKPNAAYLASDPNLKIPTYTSGLDQNFRHLPRAALCFE